VVDHAAAKYRNRRTAPQSRTARYGGLGAVNRAGWIRKRPANQMA
jgi:hypothetical protein